MTRTKTFLSVSAALVVLALATAPDAVRALVGGGYASAAEAASSTTVADDTFGAGGSKQSLSNDKHELLAEIWRDKSGVIREQFESAAGGEQFWGFFNGDGVSTSEWRRSMIAIRPMARPAGRWEMWVIGPGDTTIKEYSTLSRAELDTEFDYWHRQMRTWVNGFLRSQQGGNG